MVATEVWQSSHFIPSECEVLAPTPQGQFDPNMPRTEKANLRLGHFYLIQNIGAGGRGLFAEIGGKPIEELTQSVKACWFLNHFLHA